MLFIHPVIQCSATLLALYVLGIGVQRFRSLHLKQKVKFNWKRHVLLGQIALITMLTGMLGGAVMSYATWHGFLVTGTHGKVALVMLPLILFGLFSGLYMDRRKKKRTLLPLIHGLNNMIVLALALYQISSGRWVVNVYILGN
ncbi:DUF4079 family protein [Thermodesulfobacteriota bacterium]